MNNKEINDKQIKIVQRLAININKLDIRLKQYLLDRLDSVCLDHVKDKLIKEDLSCEKNKNGVKNKLVKNNK
ncbi:MAG: hypothetical protein K2X69_10640 [Silvanigrellaceae bacterium]|nr:hypothetical protein [Silvanigrellaceae bacterium]